MNNDLTVFFDGGCVFISLRARDGSIRALAIADEDDFDLIRQYRWRLYNRGHHVGGRLAGSRGPTHYMHHIVLGQVPTRPLEVDHIDGNGLNNKRSNLRIVTKSQNQQNKSRSHGSSRFRGVYWDRSRDKWHAQVCLNGKMINLGRYSSEEEAGAVSYKFREENFIGDRQWT